MIRLWLIKFVKEDSINVSEDGNYSLQVLSEALKRIAMLDSELVDVKKYFSNENSLLNFECFWSKL